MGATGCVRAGTWDGALDPDPARRPVQVVGADPPKEEQTAGGLSIRAALSAYWYRQLSWF
jgi:hypothetical protein